MKEPKKRKDLESNEGTANDKDNRIRYFKEQVAAVAYPIEAGDLVSEGQNRVRCR